jgi:hypothetical protein
MQEKDMLCWIENVGDEATRSVGRGLSAGFSDLQFCQAHAGFCSDSGDPGLLCVLLTPRQW